MFWGLIMEPNKKYAQEVNRPFHISQAALDVSGGDNGMCQVMVKVEDKNFLVCTLQSSKSVQVPLDMYFKPGDNICFMSNGKSNVHLTGYLDPEYEDEQSEEGSDAESEEDDVTESPYALTGAKNNKRKLLENHDSNPSKKAKKDKKGALKLPTADSSDDDSEEPGLKVFNFSSDDDDDEDDEEQKEEEEDDDEDDEEQKEEEEDDDEEADDSVSEPAKVAPEVDMSKLSKNQRRKLKLKLKQEQLKAQTKPQVNGVDKARDKKQEKKDKKKEILKEEAAAEKKEKKTVSGGVQIEDLKVGDGPVAKPGKTVMVYYEGRLKQNNKKFDDCHKGPGFKFRLGAKEVITGWDVGITGMKRGGKRRIVCPPAMAYGAKGSPPLIPPNSSLVFDVELKEIK